MQEYLLNGISLYAIYLYMYFVRLTISNNKACLYRYCRNVYEAERNALKNFENCELPQQ